MKIRDSGMPAEEVWASFFNPQMTLHTLELTSTCHDVVEFGCGYGTFTVPAARMVSGTVYALDLEPEMISCTGACVDEAGLTNVQFIERDFIADGTGLADGIDDYVMLFNILHPERPVELLDEARRNLREGGVLGIIHWNYDATTPRGPDMQVRPRPEQISQWAEQAGFEPLGDGIVDLEPYHYGMALRTRAD